MLNDGSAPSGLRLRLISVPFVLLALIAVVVWVPFRSGDRPRHPMRVQLAEGAAYMSGLAVDRAKIAAFTLGGFFGCGGLFLAIQTSSGNADIPQAGAYTLNSIASVVIGEASAAGRYGQRDRFDLGAHHAARNLVLLRESFDIAPLLQPLFEGVVPRGRAYRRAARPGSQEHAGVVSVTAFPASLTLSRDNRPMRHRRAVHRRDPYRGHRLHARSFRQRALLSRLLCPRFRSRSLSAS